MDSIDELLDGVFDSAGVSPSPDETPPPDQSPEPDAPPAIAPISAEAESVDDVAAEPLADVSSAPEPTPEPVKPAWDSDDNPYRTQAETLTKALELAVRRKQAEQDAEQLAARDKLIAELPNMDPVQARIVAAQLAAWEERRAAERVKAVESQTEPLLKELAIRRLGERLSLTADERKDLEQFNDPQQMAWAAQTMVANRKQRETETSQLRNQLAELQRRVQAQERINSPVDRVAVGSGPAIAPQDAETLDDFLDALDLPTGSRWRASA